MLCSWMRKTIIMLASNSSPVPLRRGIGGEGSGDEAIVTVQALPL